MKITEAQRKALQTIQDNPGKVIAWKRGHPGWMTINGNVENRLNSQGLAKAVPSGVTASNPIVGTFELPMWEITDAGREALGINTDDDVGPNGIDMIRSLVSFTI